MRNGTPCSRQEARRSRRGPRASRADPESRPPRRPSRRLIAIGGVDAQDQLGSRRDGQGNFGRVEAVDRHAETSLTQRLDGIADAVPGRARVAAQVDHVGSVPDELLGLGDQLVADSRGT